MIKQIVKSITPPLVMDLARGVRRYSRSPAPTDHMPGPEPTDMAYVDFYAHTRLFALEILRQRGRPLQEMTLFSLGNKLAHVADYLALFGRVYHNTMLKTAIPVEVDQCPAELTILQEDFFSLPRLELDCVISQAAIHCLNDTRYHNEGSADGHQRGYQAAQKLRQIIGSKSIPVIVSIAVHDTECFIDDNSRLAHDKFVASFAAAGFTLQEYFFDYLCQGLAHRPEYFEARYRRSKSLPTIAEFRSDWSYVIGNDYFCFFSFMATTTQYPYTWEQAVEILRHDPKHQQLIRDSYLTADRIENCRRFLDSAEFKEVLAIIRAQAPEARRVLDIPGGNGIASFAFAKSGFAVASVEPDPSNSVGRGAIDFVVQHENLTNVNLVDAYGEALPFADDEFDVAYVRQGLHHARDLSRFISEITRVLRADGLLIASREPVVDDYGKGLQDFLAAQPDHQLYGGENALTHDDYLGALRRPQLKLIRDLGPHESIINLHPRSFDELKQAVLNSRSGKILRSVLPEDTAYRLALALAQYRHREQGRLHTFIARKVR